MASPAPAVIDTDPGLDDALALIFALRSSRLDVKAITVVAGNVSVSRCTSNVLRILEAAAVPSPPPVFEGCATPLSLPVTRAEHVHGSDGIGGISGDFPVRRLAAQSEHGADAIVSLARHYGPRLTLIALGPLTNVAAALQRDGEALRSIGKLVVMGGSADGRGNATASAEFNFFADPLAARTVVRAGLPLVIVGLNVTRRALLPKARFERHLSSMPRTTLRSFLAACSAPYFDFCQKHESADSCALHDPLAVGAAIDPGLVATEVLECDVIDRPGLTRGMMLVDRGEPGSETPTARVATDVNSPKFLDLFLETVCAA